MPRLKPHEYEDDEPHSIDEDFDLVETCIFCGKDATKEVIFDGSGTVFSRYSCDEHVRQAEQMAPGFTYLRTIEVS